MVTNLLCCHSGYGWRMQFDHLKRREFITLLGGAAATWPLAARAQQGRIWRIGYLTASTATGNPYFEAFEEGLRALGYIEGQNLALDTRGAQGDVERLPVLMQELIALRPDIITVVATPAAVAAHRATSTIPIVMLAVTDPVASGIVKSIARPEGNVTGISHMSLDVTAKALEILKAITPDVTRIAVLMSLNPVHSAQFREAEIASRGIGVTVVPIVARTPQEFDKAFATIEQEKCQAIIVLADGLYLALIELANRMKLPTLYQISQFVRAGGLIGYGPDFRALFRRGAAYVDRILKGAKPADLPIERPTKFELVINLRTAKALGLEVPATLLALADEVIE
jgi:putative tryptophan/tyrosine transport system substrate-binding protein